MSNAAPWPYDVEIAGAGYLKPPDEVMFALRDSWYRRRSLPWFPTRQQGSAISESLLPPQSETSLTIRDRSGGFGWSDAQGGAGDEVTTYAYSDAVDAGADGDGQGVDCSVPGVVMLGPKMNTVALTGGTGAMSGHFELTVSGTRYVYVVMGTKMFRSSDGVSWSAVQANGSDLPGALSAPPKVFQGVQSVPQVYFPLGTGAVFRTWNGNTATGFGYPATATYGDNESVIAFEVDDTALWAVWRDTTSATQAYRLNKFYDGIAAGSAGAAEPSWLPSIAVSDRSDPAQFLMLAHNRLYVGCYASLRELAEERDSMRGVLWQGALPSTSNFKAHTVWGNELWFTAQQGAFRLLPAGGQGSVAFEQVGPESLPNNRTPVRGSITALAGDDYCLYAFIQNEDGVTYLLKYRYYDGGRRAAFHSVLRIGSYTVPYAFISGVQGTNPILYFGTGSEQMRYIVLPRNGYYPPGDANYEFCARGHLYDSRQYGGLYFVTKALVAWTGRAENLSATEKITPAYRTSIADAFTEWGSELTADPGARMQLLSPVSCAWWEGRTKLERGSTASDAPRLLASTTHYALRPPAKGHFTVYVWIYDYSKARNGLRDRRSAADIEATLIDLDSTATVATLVNKRGLTYDVLIDEVEIVYVGDEADKPVSAVAKITASEYAARTAGAHAGLGAFTHGVLGGYTHAQLSVLL